VNCASVSPGIRYFPFRLDGAGSPRDFDSVRWADLGDSASFTTTVWSARDALSIHRDEVDVEERRELGAGSAGAPAVKSAGAEKECDGKEPHGKTTDLVGTPSLDGLAAQGWVGSVPSHNNAWRARQGVQASSGRFGPNDGNPGRGGSVYRTKGFGALVRPQSRDIEARLGM